MKIVSNNSRKVRTVFAWQEGNEFLLSPFEMVSNGRRPIGRFDTKEELEASVQGRGCEVKWLIN